MRKFKAKKRKNNKLKKIIIVLFLIFLIYEIITSINLKMNIATNNEEFIRKMLNDTNHHQTYEKYNNNLVRKALKILSNFDIKKPTTILKKTFGYNIKTKENKEIAVATKQKTNYIEDPNPTVIDNPKIYIYNTHQSESYSASNFEDYNITPNVMMASYMLKEKLNKINIPTIVETSNINDFLNLNGWDYASSYKASRFYVIDTLNKYKNLDLLIDIHRDSISKEKSTTIINNKKCAKVLFVVGAEHKNYKENLNITTKLNNLIKNKYPNLTRGIIIKKGKGVNGIYNQDLSPKSVLIELGGEDNSIDEVMNTTELLTEIIKEYIGD